MVLLAIPRLMWGQPAGILVQPPSAWVREVEWPTGPPAVGTNQAEGAQYLLFERQLHPQLKEEFHRTVLHMRNETGVQDSGNLTFSFDPGYQHLILHRVQIHRAGQRLDRLDREKIRLIQPESGLGAHVFTGRKTAVLFVEDLRVGDVLEYAVTTHGVNPVMGGHFATRLYQQSSVPVDRQRHRVVWPYTRPLNMRQNLVQSGLARSAWEQGHEYVWDATNQTALAYEDRMPADFEPYPYWELSDFSSWAEVVDWALPLYEIGTNLAPELQPLVERWLEEAAADEERARLALQFVQDELRYTGLELGPDSYRPAPAVETFNKRFGDCKGKVLLLCTLLRAMKIEAWPVLVNSEMRGAIARRLPSPFAFNHVIVKLKLPGQEVWVDPTITHQGGRIRERHLPRLDQGLVVRTGVATLEEIPTIQDRNSQETVSSFTITAHDAPVGYTVTTTFRGADADAQREELARVERSQVQKNYLNFAARYYPGVTNAQPLIVSDDRLDNVMQVTEQYQIRDLWSLDKSSKQWVASFYADSLVNLLPDPATRLRKYPLRIPFPVRRQHTVVVHLPSHDKDWNISESRQTIADAAFTYRFHRQFNGLTIKFEHECETKVPEISAVQVSAYLKHWEQVEDNLGDVLQRPNGEPAGLAGINWLMAVVAAFGFAGAVVLGAWGWRATRAPATAPPPLPLSPELQGLGGWLILVGFGLCVAPFARVGQMAHHWQGFFGLNVWEECAMRGGSQYHPLFGPLLTFEVLGNSALLGFNLLMIGLFFAKHRIFPKAYIVLMSSNALFLLVDEMLSGAVPSVAAQDHGSSRLALVRTVMQALLWSAYMLKSRRVKVTFVR